MGTRHDPWTGFVLIGLFLSGVMYGCGGGGGLTYSGPTGTAQGRVTYKGQPVTEGRVVFFAPPYSAVGDIQADGTYTLKWQGRSSIPVGEYKVYVEPPRPAGAATDDAPVTISHPSIPDKYQLSSTSDLTATVKEGENAIPDLDMK
jgi:hypothetical protein